jgi:hypothetical protein
LTSSGCTGTLTRVIVAVRFNPLLVLLACSLLGIADGSVLAETADLAETTDESPENPLRADWIPVGAVSPEAEYRAVQARSLLQSRSTPMQREALRSIEADIDRFGRAEMRLAAAPLIIDLLGREYRILETPPGFTVEASTRESALRLLAHLGGEAARGQLRESLSEERDPAIRAYAASLLAATPGDDPDLDYRTIGDALLRAHQRGGEETEVRRLMESVERLSGDVWNAEYPPLLQALVGIAGGSYSSSTRKWAMSFLEELSER